MTGKYSIFSLIGCLALVGCAGMNNYEEDVVYETPTVDYIERLDVNDAPHKDSFLNQLAVNYRSYAVYNAKTSGYPDIGELFAQKAVSAFSGETPFPETLDSWTIDDDAERFKVYNAYNNLIDQLKNDAAYDHPQLTAEAQAKFDCWISAAASGQNATAQECRHRFNSALKTLSECNNGKVVEPTRVKSENVAPVAKTEKYYPETHRLDAMSGASRTREGVIIVNNVNIPSNLINPVPVPQQAPMVFNQNIYGGTENMEGDEIPELQDEYVSRDEFINMMMAMRSELAAINKRLDDMDKGSDKTVIKVQQIPLEPTQHIMEEIFEIRFDFDKANIKPEYEDIIKKLGPFVQGL